jgi:hypothetical protein
MVSKDFEGSGRGLFEDSISTSVRIAGEIPTEYILNTSYHYTNLFDPTV